MTADLGLLCKLPFKSMQTVVQEHVIHAWLGNDFVILCNIPLKTT